jgi:hypothetical protein
LQATQAEEFKADAGQTGHSTFPVRWASRHPHPLPPREEARAIHRYVLAVSTISGCILPIAIFFILCVDLCRTHPISSIICPYHIWVAQVARFGRPTQRTLERNFPTPFPISTISPAIANLQFFPNTITMATMAANDRETTQPTCQNCTTSTTPLWRRDEIGSVLCNACGLFLKLHGRPRPISLKTDVIKSRNRVKSSGSAQGAKKKVSSSLFYADVLEREQTLTRRRRAYSTPMVSSRRDRKEELHPPEPSVIDEPPKNPRTVTLMARTLPSPVLRRPRCMLICPLSTAAPSMIPTITPHRCHNSTFVNHLPAALPPP